MTANVPISTIGAFARTIVKEAAAYGFSQMDIIRLVNEILDSCTDEVSIEAQPDSLSTPKIDPTSVATLPLVAKNVRIRRFDKNSDTKLLGDWLPEKYGRFFVLSCATARSDSVDALVGDERNHFGIITLRDGAPIGALAFLDHNAAQHRAELRKLIGVPEFRGKGLAEEATRLWIAYGFAGLDLEKIYVSTLQTHLSNIRLNERIGFQVEGLLRNEVLIDGERRDVLRMGICRA